MKVYGRMVDRYLRSTVDDMNEKKLKRRFYVRVKNAKKESGWTPLRVDV